MKSNKYSKEEAKQLLINSIQESIIPSNPASTSSNDSNVKKLTFYSDYGYIEVLKEDYENDSLIVIPFTNKNKLYGSILKAHCLSTFNVIVKTFYGKRRSYSLNVDISDMITDLISKLIIEENSTTDPSEDHWKYNSQYRLCVSQKDKLRELHPLRSVKDEELQRNQVIVLLPQRKVRFHDSFYGPNILLESNNTIAVKSGSDDLQLVFSDQGYKVGRHYIEFIFETEPAEKSILVGLSLSRSDYYFSIGDPRGFWGFIPSECLKLGYNEKNQVEKKEFGAPCKINDSIGMLLEFTNRGLDVTYFINRVNMGVAFKNLSLQTYYACIALGFDSSKVRIIEEAEFPDF